MRTVLPVLATFVGISASCAGDGRSEPDFSAVSRVDSGTAVAVMLTAYSTTLRSNGTDRTMLRIAVTDSASREITSAADSGSGFRKVGREELLGIKGIGPETADSILLYALGRPYFVVDAYTRRVFSRLGVVKGSEKYEELRRMFEQALPKDGKVYREYHALIVELGKRHCRKKPLCEECPLGGFCRRTTSP